MKLISEWQASVLNLEEAVCTYVIETCDIYLET